MFYIAKYDTDGQMSVYGTEYYTKEEAIKAMNKMIIDIGAKEESVVKIKNSQDDYVSITDDSTVTVFLRIIEIANYSAEKAALMEKIAYGAIGAYLDANEMSPDEMLDDMGITDDEFKTVMHRSIYEE